MFFTPTVQKKLPSVILINFTWNWPTTTMTVKTSTKKFPYHQSPTLKYPKSSISNPLIQHINIPIYPNSQFPKSSNIPINKTIYSPNFPVFIYPHIQLSKIPSFTSSLAFSYKLTIQSPYPPNNQPISK